MTITITTELHDELTELARLFATEADNEDTLELSDEWHKDAGSIRLVAHMVRTTGAAEWLAIGESWLIAGRTMHALRTSTANA